MIQCKVCERQPSSINEYVYGGIDEQCTPEEFVVANEGTYNRRTQKFYCTECYVSIGMPLGTA